MKSIPQSVDAGIGAGGELNVPNVGCRGKLSESCFHRFLDRGVPGTAGTLRRGMTTGPRKELAIVLETQDVPLELPPEWRGWGHGCGGG